MKNKKNIALALKYPVTERAPLIVAKGKDRLAQKMLELAMENNIPVVEDDLAANVLSVEEIGQCLREETWPLLAKIFVYIQEMEKNGSSI